MSLIGITASILSDNTKDTIGSFYEKGMDIHLEYGGLDLSHLLKFMDEISWRGISRITLTKMDHAYHVYYDDIEHILDPRSINTQPTDTQPTDTQLSDDYLAMITCLPFVDGISDGSYFYVGNRNARKILKPMNIGWNTLVLDRPIPKGRLMYEKQDSWDAFEAKVILYLVPGCDVEGNVQSIFDIQYNYVCRSLDIYIPDCLEGNAISEKSSFFVVTPGSLGKPTSYSKVDGFSISLEALIRIIDSDKEKSFDEVNIILSGTCIRHMLNQIPGSSSIGWYCKEPFIRTRNFKIIVTGNLISMIRLNTLTTKSFSPITSLEVVTIISTHEDLLTSRIAIPVDCNVIVCSPLTDKLLTTRNIKTKLRRVASETPTSGARRYSYIGSEESLKEFLEGCQIHVEAPIARRRLDTPGIRKILSQLSDKK